MGEPVKVKVVSIFQHPDGRFTVRGTVDRDEVPQILRLVAEQIEDADHE